MVLPTRFGPQKTNANYPAHPAPGQKRFHAALNLLNSHLSQPRCGIVAPGLGTLLLRCSRNILILRSESGRTIGWAQAHFFVAAGGDEHSTGLGRGVFK
jgi:hypothetical protein